ncbi:sensor histidine kinase [Candidatus Cryosericum septentrionale]|jgi:signal transduction histidine kinase|nr:ATP-binding protein [Candidatus Cryosericum septentrionale]
MVWMKRMRHLGALGVAILLLITAIVLGSLMRSSTRGAADPDTQEITTAEVNTTVRERITSLDPDVMTEAAVRGAIEDQLPALGARGFIRLSIPSKHIDVLIGTDYSLDNVMGISVQQNTWQYRLSLAPVNAPEELQSLYVTYMSTGMGNISGELMIGSAGPTAAQVRTSLSLMIAMWACLCLAAVCIIAVFVTPANHIAHRTRAWTPLRRGLTMTLVGALVAVPVVWTLASRTHAAAREQFARGTDLVVTSAVNTMSEWLSTGEVSAAYLHATYTMSYPDCSFRILVDGKLQDRAGVDYGPAAYQKPGDPATWRQLAPFIEGGTPRPAYLTTATKGGVRVELVAPEPDYWQDIHLRHMLFWAIPALFAVLFALGYLTGRRPESTVPSSEEILRHAVARQAVLTVLVVCLALVPAAGWFVQTYEAAAVGQLDKTLQHDAAALSSLLSSLDPSVAAKKSLQIADSTLAVARTGMVFSLKFQLKDGRTDGFNINPAESMLSVVTGTDTPTVRIIANNSDWSVPPGHSLAVRVIGASGRLKDGTVYTFLLGTTMRPVQQDMQELWKAAAWAGPVAFLFIVLAGLIAASLALHPVAESMRRLERFTGDAGHELRTPLSSIRLNAQVALNQDQQPEEFRRHLTAITSQAERSTHLSESLLLLAGLDREQSAPLAPVQLLDIWTDLHSAHAEALNAKSVTLQTPSKALTVTANRELLTIALDNLVENAVRYAPEGTTVAITALRTGGTVTIAVADQGPGVPPEALPHIWNRFTRIDPSRSRESGGSGLGLAIVRKAVEAMHGRVAVTSEVGRGSTFSIILPARTADL